MHATSLIYLLYQKMQERSGILCSLFWRKEENEYTISMW